MTSLGKARPLFTTMRTLMHRDSLRLALCGQFDSVSQERRIIQSREFLPVLTAWANVLLRKGRKSKFSFCLSHHQRNNMDYINLKTGDDRPQPFGFTQNESLSRPPSDIFVDKEVKHLLKTNPRVRWLLERMSSGDSLSRGKPVFPSTYKLKGPQWPFSPRQMNWLETKAGELRGMLFFI